MLKETVLYEFLLRAKRLSEVEAWLFTFDDQLKDQIIEWIRDDQLRDQGVNELGVVIGYYSYATEIFNPKKKYGTPYTLNDTGAFVRSITVDVFSDMIQIDADAQKSSDDNLFEMYGDGIVGLTFENMEKLSLRIKERIHEYIRKVLFDD